MSGPPRTLVARLVERGLVSGLQWRQAVGSTNTLAAQAATAGVPELYAVLADEQSAGRGRLGRTWQAPPGTSLLCSLVLRPAVAVEALRLLPLLIGLCLVEAVEAFRPALEVGVKWPNDLLIGGRKAGGVLVEAGRGDAVIAGIGVNVDWRGVQRPEELAASTSLAEAMDVETGAPVDRWDVLVALLDAFGARYGAWQRQPHAFLDDYHRHSATLGRAVRAQLVGADPVCGCAVALTPDGALLIGTADGRIKLVTAADVEHLRPA